MITPEFVMPKYVSLKNHPDINEKWLQDRLTENPELLGLNGDLVARDSERSQPGGGRLDLLLADVEADIRYEVEIQLGVLDPSHIIRTIEYWDIERRRYPQYEHIAVIVAEEVTGRFHNVISLLNSNGAIPLIAIQIKGVEVNGALTFVATRVVDLLRLGTEEENAGETVDRSSWEWASDESMVIMDRLFNMINEVQPNVSPRYNKNYIGLEYEGKARNFVDFEPRKKSYVLAKFRIPQDDELMDQLDDKGFSGVQYRRGRFRVQVRQSHIENNPDILLDLIRRAHDADSRM